MTGAIRSIQDRIEKLDQCISRYGSTLGPEIEMQIIEKITSLESMKERFKKKEIEKLAKVSKSRF